MIISVPSNVVTAVYTVFCDVSLPLTVSFVASLLLSSWNVKLLYSDRRSLPLKTTNLVIHHQGFSEKRAGFLVALISTIVLLLGIAGEYSITGITKSRRASDLAPVMTTGGSEDDLIDYRDHVSRDGQNVSATFLFAYESESCVERGDNVVRYFSAKNKFRDMNTVNLPVNTTLGNSTCMMDEDGYVDKESLVFNVSTDKDRKLNRRITFPNCSHTFKPEATSDTYVAKADVTLSGDCPFTFLLSWCAKYETEVCIISIKHGGGYYVGHNSGPKSIVTYNERFLPYPIPSNAVRSLAYLTGTQAGGAYLHGRGLPMSLLTIRENVEVKKRAEEFEETDVNVLFLLLTVGIALFLHLVLACIAWVIWRKFVVSRGLQGHNRFYSLHDILRYVRQDFERDSNRISKGTEQSLMIGISRKVPHVGLLGDSDDEGDYNFQENELEGR